MGPDGPLSSVTVGGVVSSVNTRSSGVASVLPASSTARTRTVWLPSTATFGLYGDEQLAKAAPSIAHWRRAGDSLDPRVNAGVTLTGSDGAADTVVSGARRSIL